MVYFMQSGTSGPIKIGFTAKDDIRQRIANLQTASIEPLNLLGVMEGDATKEKELHHFFHSYKIRGEWFEPHPKLLMYIMGLILGKSADELYTKLVSLNSVAPGLSDFSITEYLQEIETHILSQALENTNWHIKLAAEQVGLTFRQMRYRIERCKLIKPRKKCIA
jgi:transcriptional regulator with GAF, ATPase, and Fis domain